MDRKKIILIAAMVNACLLIILFIGALSNQETVQETGLPVFTQSNTPLFSDTADLALQREITLLDTIESQAVPIATAEPAVTQEKEQPPLHKLPPIAPEPVAKVVAPSIETTPSLFLEVTVKKGDNLEKIAKMHHTTSDAIVKLNHLPGSFLKVGQVLKIPKKGEENKLAAVAVPVEKVNSSSQEYYTVKVGDNPWSIAMKHHMKVEELLKLNGLSEENARKLKPGNRLRIR